MRTKCHARMLSKAYDMPLRCRELIKKIKKIIQRKTVAIYDIFKKKLQK
jgi:hypothetical protein